MTRVDTSIRSDYVCFALERLAIDEESGGVRPSRDYGGLHNGGHWRSVDAALVAAGGGRSPKGGHKGRVYGHAQRFSGTIVNVL